MHYTHKAASLTLIGYSCTVNSSGIKATCPVVLSTKYCLAFCFESAAVTAIGMVTIKIAFSCTWYPNMKLQRHAYTAAGRKLSGLGFRHKLKRQGSMASSTNARVTDGEGEGSTANWVTWTRPPAEQVCQSCIDARSFPTSAYASKHCCCHLANKASACAHTVLATQ